MSFLLPGFMLWMAAVVMLCLMLPRYYQMPFVSLATLGFLLFYSPWSALSLTVLLTVSYFSMQRWHSQVKMVLLVGFCISFLFVCYKYLLQEAIGGGSRHWLLLGASFYVFRVIHYLVESYKGSLPRHGLADYLNYMLFLPVIVAGPINRFDEFLREERRRRWDSRRFSSGLERILYGYVKIVLLAGYAVNVKLYWYIESLSADEVWLRSYLKCVEYGLDLYLKFSGYSDIAIGFALLLGVRVSENFHYPFIQPNISKFWKSWHISLSSWCRDYVYMPIAAHYRHSFLGIIVSMLILGLWHELSLRYVVWGAYHGLGIVVWQYFQQIKPQWLSTVGDPMRHVVTGVSVVITFNFVILGFAITMSDSLQAAIGVYQNLLFMGD